MKVDHNLSVPEKDRAWFGARSDLSWGFTLLVVAAILRIIVYKCCAAPFEDALIILRYARNIAGGMGFVYNPGEHVLGTTTPLWTIVNAFYICAFGTERVFAFGFWLNLCLDTVTITAIFSVLRRDGIGLPASIGAVIPLACLSPFVFITSSEMETSLFMALLALSLLELQSEKTVLSAALAGLLALCRPEGFLWGGIASACSDIPPP